MNLEINYKKKSEKGTKIWRLNNRLLNNEWIIEEIKGEIKKYLETNEMITFHTKSYGMQQSGIKREIHHNTATS